MRPSDTRLFAERWIRRTGDWIVVAEWFAHHTLALPAEWLKRATDENAGLAERIEVYHAAALAPTRAPVRLHPARDVPSVDGTRTFRYQTIKGRAPLCVNADLIEFFEALTPGARWWLAFPDHLLYEGRVVHAPMVARVHPKMGVRFAVAPRDPRLA